MIDKVKEEEIKHKIDEIVSAHGAELVELKIFHSAGQYTIRCLIDYPQGGITVEECSSANRDIVSYLELNAILGEGFTVEVNSPGLDRRLTDFKDFLRAQNDVVGVWFSEPVENREYIEGEVVNVNEDKLYLKIKNQTVEIDLNKVKMGKRR